MRNPSVLVLCLTLLGPLVAQGGVFPNSDFERGNYAWNNVRFDDPAGSTGVAKANVSGAGVSSALFADFKTVARDSWCNWLSDYQLLPPGRYPVTFHVMWQKPQVAAILDPSGNYIEFYVLDAQDRHVFSSHLPATQKATIVDRKSFSGDFVVPVSGRYRLYAILHHSTGAGTSYSAWIDDIVVGSIYWSLFGQGCQGSGSFTPSIHAVADPLIGSSSFALRLVGATAPTTAVLALGASNTAWGTTALPLDIGGGCAIAVSLDGLFVAPVTGSGPGAGTASVGLPIPSQPALRGIEIHCQWAVGDPGSGSPFGLAVTQGLSFVIG